MVKVIRTTPIDRSKRTAAKGDVVGTVNIISGKRNRRNSNNFPEYMMEEPRTSKKKSKSGKKSTNKRKQRELSEDEEEEVTFTSEEEEQEESFPIIKLAGNKKKFEIVDYTEDKVIVEEPEEESEEEEEDEEPVEKPSKKKKQETKIKKEKKSKKDQKDEETKPKPIETLLPFDEETDVLPHALHKFNPLSYFSSRIVDRVRELGGLFPLKFNRAAPFRFHAEEETLQYDAAVKLFSMINWQGKACKFIVALCDLTQTS